MSVNNERTNIEIYQASLEDGVGIKERIIKILFQAGLLNETTICTIAHCHPESCCGSLIWRPYIRVCETNDERRRMIICALKEGNLKIDTEILLLPRFIPAEEMVR